MSGNNYYLECMYCGLKWTERWVPGTPKCTSCGDKNIKVDHKKNEDVFGYETDEKGKSKNISIEELLSNDMIKWGSD